MAPIDKSLTNSLQMVYQWTEELSIRTNGANRKASLTNGDLFTNGTIGEDLLTIGICLCILDMCGFGNTKRLEILTGYIVDYGSLN